LLQRVPEETGAGGNKEANLEIYRDQLSELEADLRNGIISPEQYQQDRDEIERRLLDDVSKGGEVSAKGSKQAAGRGPVYVIALGIPVLAVALYLLVGNSAAWSGAATTTPQTPFASGAQGSAPMTQQGIEANVAALAKRLEQKPDDAQGWVMLARSYTSLEKYNEASSAYAKAAALKTDDADLLADYAFAMGMASGRKLQGEPFELIKKALRIDPQNAKALELAGSAEFQARNYQQAVAYWQKVLDRTPADSELARTLSQNISEAKALAGVNPK
jgi:cytochrome c-type biogenesis protein CcmH